VGEEGEHLKTRGCLDIRLTGAFSVDRTGPNRVERHLLRLGRSRDNKAAIFNSGVSAESHTWLWKWPNIKSSNYGES
jgi:hypothetical protein